MNLLKKTAAEFSEDRCTQMAAALAFYTMLSLAPLLVIIVTIASLVMGPPAQQSITQQASRLIGPTGAEELEELLNRGQQQQALAPSADDSSADNSSVDESQPQEAQSQGTTPSQESDSGWTVPTIIMNAVSLLVLIFSATGVVAQLQASLNQVWEVAPDPEQSGIFGFFKKRLLSFAMILGIAFLLLVSMLLTTALGALGSWISSNLGVGNIARYAISEGTTFVIVAILFAAMFKILPDAKVPWKVTWIGALMTALLFTIGKFLIGLYLGNKDMSSAYGQAGSLVLVLLWAYYSAMIFFFGAELTQVWARRHGHAIEPSDGAVRVVERREHVRSSTSDNGSGGSAAKEETSRA